MTSEAQNIVGIYRRHADAWALARARESQLYERGWLDRFRGLLPPGGAVLDIGCGSGQPIAAHLSKHGFAVTGVDASPEMVDMFRKRLPDQQAHVADMRVLSLPHRFNGLLAWDSFFHLDHEDQRRMFPVFAAHAAPGAALMFTSGPSYGEAIGEFGGEALYHASLDEIEYRQLLASIGFDVVAQVAEDPTCGGRTVWLARLQ